MAAMQTIASSPGSWITMSSQNVRDSSRSTTPTSASTPTPAMSVFARTSQDGTPDPSVAMEKKAIDWNDPRNTYNPFNWPDAKKWRVTALASFMTFVIQINGTMMTSAAEQINESFHISDERFPHSYWPVLSWNLGGAAAPLLGLPLMENLGVRKTYMAIYFVFIVFIVPQAAAQNFATLVVTRIITGACSGVLANITSGIVSDIWRVGRAKSFGTSLYIWSLLAGLNMGPVFGSLAVRYTTWRWIFIAQIIFYSALLPVIFFLLPEVRPDVILAQRMSTDKEANLQSSAHTTKKRTSIQEILRETLVRPTRLLCTESVVLSFGLWSAFCIGIAFMFTQSIVQVYSELYGWSYFGTGLVQSAIVIGELIGLVTSLYQDRLYFRSAKRNVEHLGEPIPEARLYLSIPASFIGLMGGFVFFAWTSYSTIPWIVPSIALAFVGFGMFCSTAAVTTYVVDAYAKYAASAVAGIAFLENFMAAFLPLATQSMYRTLGFQWASSVLGFIALALSFIPLVLLRYGRRIRARSPFMNQAGYEED